MWSRNWCFLLWCGRTCLSLHWSKQILSRSFSARQSTGSECHSSNILPLGSACLGNLHHCWFTTWNHGTQVFYYSGWVSKELRTLNRFFFFLKPSLIKFCIYVRKCLPLTMKSCFYPLIGDKVCLNTEVEHYSVHVTDIWVGWWSGGYLVCDSNIVWSLHKLGSRNYSD